MQTYYSEEWKILSYVVLTPNMDWNHSVLNFSEDEYDERLETFGLWTDTVEHVIPTMNFKVLIDTTQNLIFCSNLISSEEPTVSNIRLEAMCGGMYPFMKPLPVRDKQSDSFPSIDYKAPLVTREDKYVGNLPGYKTPDKSEENSKP